MPFGGYSGCFEVQGVCCAAVLSVLQLLYLGFGRSMSRPGPEEILSAIKPSGIRFVIALNVIRIELVSAR